MYLKVITVQCLHMVKQVLEKHILYKEVNKIQVYAIELFKIYFREFLILDKMDANI